MDKLISSKLGKLKIITSLPFLPDSICIKTQTIAEQGYTQIVLCMILATYLDLSAIEECELIELAIFAELPKSLIGEPNHYLRIKHSDSTELYEKTKGKIWKNMEKSLGIETTKSSTLYGLYELTKFFSLMLFIDKECLLGNQFFLHERYKTIYFQKRNNAFANEDLSKKHPCSLLNPDSTHQITSMTKFNWKDVFTLLDDIYDEANQARLENGISGYSSTFLGMLENLKEHSRYKGLDCHYTESVSQHIFQVIFLCRLVAKRLGLSEKLKIQLYHAAAIHDFAATYASDMYPIKIREKELIKHHKQIEKDIIQSICSRFRLSWPNDPYILAIVDICNRFSSQIYYDKEIRSGNNNFNLPNTSMEIIRDFYEKDYPEIFQELDNLWLEYISSL